MEVVVVGDVGSLKVGLLAVVGVRVRGSDTRWVWNNLSKGSTLVQLRQWVMNVRVMRIYLQSRSFIVVKNCCQGCWILVVDGALSHWRVARHLCWIREVILDVVDDDQ
ncbi:hypothetical protein Droror1_Dr00002565 [Drosera rotundifolia]